MTEAGIAAHLALNPNLIPPEIAELSDQAAIFASNNVNIFKFTGAADADSEATNIGTSVAVKAIERAIEIDERRKREDNSADADVIAAAGQAIREDLAELQQVSVGGVELSLEEWNEVADALKTDEGINAARDALMAQGKTAEQANEIIRITQLLASAAQKQHDGIPLTAEEAAAVDKVKNDPNLQDDVRTTTDAAMNPVSQSDLSLVQVEDRNAATAEQTSEWKAQQNDFAETIGYDEIAAADFADRAQEVGNGTSMTNTTDLASSFEAGFSPSSEFNTQGLGTAQIATNELSQTGPAQTSSLQELKV